MAYSRLLDCIFEGRWVLAMKKGSRKGADWDLGNRGHGQWCGCGAIAGAGLRLDAVWGGLRGGG